MNIENFNSRIQETLDRRQEIFLNLIFETLDDANIEIDTILEDENFITLLLHALQVSKKNHDPKKITGLKNIILDFASNHSEYDLKLKFINLIDQFTPLSLKILIFLNNPTEFAEENAVRYSGEYPHILTVFPELNDLKELFNQLWIEFFHNGLVNIEDSTFVLHPSIPSDLNISRLNPMGSKFIHYLI